MTIVTSLLIWCPADHVGALTSQSGGRRCRDGLADWPKAKIAVPAARKGCVHPALVARLTQGTSFGLA